MRTSGSAVAAHDAASPAPRRRHRRLLVAAAASAALLATVPAAAEAGTPRPVAQQGSDGGKQFVGYFTQWGITSGFYEKNLITSGEIGNLTELDYAFGGVAPDGTCTSTDPSADYQLPFTAAQSVDGRADRPGQALAGNFNQLRELKAKYPKLKIVMAIGGWTGSGRFSALAQTAAGRRAFVASCIDQYIRGDIPGLRPHAAAGIFDGLSVDWEYPDQPGAGNPYSAQDIPDYTALLQEFRTQLDAASAGTDRHYLLTADTAPFPQLAGQLQLAQLTQYVDWLNVMTFDVYGSLEPNGPTDFSSGLYPDPRDPYPPVYQFDIANTVTFYESQGVAPGKIAISVPYYAHYWTGVAPGPNGDGLFQTATGGGTTMNYNQETGEPGTTYFDPAAGEPYKYDAASQTFYSYDSPASVALKGRYVWQQGLRGAMVWSMDGDTADGRLTAALGRSLRNP
ncbi:MULTISPECIES: glycoside hydrolase family 18 protein [Streptacidiphilus]|uniref:chitinase n=1 Tax=Streptacidiphilus cavernicola TaxID=3342716 RepID=A0ABV6UXB9_9ACTN|nr:glycoside hydrolase family 18 protein [Streptacidiphilus jeojiense]